MKLESLVIADQHAAVNTFPGLVHLSLIHISSYEKRRGRRSLKTALLQILPGNSLEENLEKGLFWCREAKTVSYTHLDVYKRQAFQEE